MDDQAISETFWQEQPDGYFSRGSYKLSEGRRVAPYENVSRNILKSESFVSENYWKAFGMKRDAPVHMIDGTIHKSISEL